MLTARSASHLEKIFGTANGNRTRILALKGLRANRCTIAAWEQSRLNNYTRNASIAPRGGLVRFYFTPSLATSINRTIDVHRREPYCERCGPAVGTLNGFAGGTS